MQQLTCTGPGHVEWREVKSPALDSDLAALVRPIAVARCDIDLFLTGGAFPISEPFALGHECVGTIEALGDAVRGLEVGQRVVVSFQVSCGSCGSCEAGNTANCDRMPTLSDYGMRPLSGVEYGGMLSDTILVPYAEAMLQPAPPSALPESLASVSDNVLDGYRAVAPHLKTRPGSAVLVVAHGIPSIPLYAVQAALALGAERVDFASGDEQCLALAERLGARPIASDFEKAHGRYPVVVDSGISPGGLRYALTSTEPEGIFQSTSYYQGGDVPVPLGRLYTLGISFYVGRCHACKVLPEVLELIEVGKLSPGEITTRTVDWDEAPEAFLQPAIKLVVRR